jgi:hypothetical protein
MTASATTLGPGPETADETIGSARAYADSSADGKYDLSRHWRNARTKGRHDPADWKYRHVGNYLLNSVASPTHGQI